MSAENKYGTLPYPGWEDLNYFAPREFLRASKLIGIPRFHAVEEMSQRTTVLDHSVRVLSFSIHFSDMLLELGVEVNQPHIIFMSDHHDDCEIVTGDIPTPVKAKATEEEKRKMDEEELEAATIIEELVGKPATVPSFREALEEYRKQETVTSRLIYYLDKWDGLHEAVHEVVTGTNKEGFRQVIRDYEPAFARLREKNKDWMEVIELFLGVGFFDFPNPDSLTPKTVQDADFSDVGAFIGSLSSGNPDSYQFWLSLNKAGFMVDFLHRTFPGWLSSVPKNVLEDIKRVKRGEERNSLGLYLPSSYLRKPTFGESLAMDDSLDRIDAMASIIREQTGRERAPDELFFYV